MIYQNQCIHGILYRPCKHDVSTDADQVGTYLLLLPILHSVHPLLVIIKQTKPNKIFETKVTNLKRIHLKLKKILKYLKKKKNVPSSAIINSSSPVPVSIATTVTSLLIGRFTEKSLPH